MSHRSVSFSRCDDLRELEIPYSWSMNWLPHGGWQQPDDLGRLRDHTRISLANICRPRPVDESKFYSAYYNCRINPHPDCTRNHRQKGEEMQKVYPAGV